MTPQELFVTRLRRHRERQRVSLDEIAVETRVKRELLDAFEVNDLTAWPRGLYARAWIRAYASAIGLDPIDTVDEFCRLFPHGDRRAGGTMRDIAAIVAAPAEYRDEIPHEDRRRAMPGAPPVRTPRINMLARMPRAVSLAHTMRILWIRVTGLVPPRLLVRGR